MLAGIASPARRGPEQPYTFWTMAQQRRQEPPRRLYVSDLDGTLLRKDGTLSPRSRLLLNRVVAAGALFTVASARSIHSMRPILSGLDLRLPVIEFNGAFISDPDSGRHEIVHAIEPSLAEDVFDVLCRDAVQPFVSSFDGERDWVHHGGAINPGVADYLDDRRRAADPRMRFTDDPRRHLGEQVVCLTAIERRAALEPVAERLRDRHGSRLQVICFDDYYQRGWTWLTVHSGEATKANAIDRLLADQGLSRHALVVFGDQVNDLSMFEIANRAVAVGNATEEVRTKATHIIGENERDSVAEFVAQDFGLEL